MKTKNSISPLKNGIMRITLGTVLILLVPFIAMQFTSEVAWDPLDFVVMGVLLFGTGLMYLLIARRVSSVSYRIIIGTVLAVLLILVWIELAVGIFD